VLELVADGEVGDLLRQPSLSLSFSGVPMDGARSLEGPRQWGVWWARFLLEEVLHHGRSGGFGGRENEDGLRSPAAGTFSFIGHRYRDDGDIPFLWIA
jgi:hypothetical protein